MRERGRGVCVLCSNVLQEDTMKSLLQTQEDIAKLHQTIQQLQLSVSADDLQLIRQQLRHIEQLQREATEAVTNSHKQFQAASNDFEVCLPLNATIWMDSIETTCSSSSKFTGNPNGSS